VTIPGVARADLKAENPFTHSRELLIMLFDVRNVKPLHGYFIIKEYLLYGKAEQVLEITICDKRKTT
jgi:hypothetical protein